MHKKTQQDGITLLITLLLMGALLGISASLLNITLKQFQLAGLIAESEVAFQAASSAMDCALYNDYILNRFEIPIDGSEQTSDMRISCAGDSDGGTGYDNSLTNAGTPLYNDPTDGNARTMNGGEMRFSQLSLSQDVSDGAPELCSEVSVYKFNGGSEVMVNNRKLWNPNGDNTCPPGAVCTVVRARGYNVPCAQRTTAKRVVERELVQVY